MKKRFCDRQIKNRYLIYIVLCSFFLGSFLGIVVHPSSATISGDYYLADFNSVASGTTVYNQTDYSDQWLKYKGSTDSVVYNHALQFNGSSGDYTFINHTMAGDEFHFSIITDYFVYNSGAYRFIDYTLYNSLGNRLMRIYTKNRYAGTDHRTNVYGKTDAIILYQQQSASDLNISGVFTFTFLNNNSIRFGCTGSLYLANVTYDVGTDFDNIVHSRIEYQRTLSLGFMRLDNYYFLKQESNPWEISSDYSFGSVVSENSNYTHYLISSEQYVIIEENYVLQSDSLMVRQFAFSVSTLTELSKMSIILHINGYECGYYDISYYYAGGLSADSRRVLVWEDINLSFYTSSLNIEIMVIGNTVPCWFEYMVFDGDVDTDGDIGHKWSSGTTASVLPYFDALYNGKSSSSISEPQYKIWAESSASVYNCGYDNDDYSYYGEYIIGTPISAGKFLEIEYSKTSSMNIKYFELFVSSSTVAAAGQTSDYYLKVNGDAIGAADCISIINDDWYRILWNVSYLNIEQKILFEVSCTSVMAISRLSFDVDEDGDTSYSYHNSFSLWEGVYSGTKKNYDVSYRLYYESYNMTFDNEISPYNDLITSTDTEFFTFDVVPIYYFISDYTYENTIEIWRNGVELDEQGFPYVVKTGEFSEEVSFFLFHNGSYQLRLMRNAVLRSSFNFTVTDPVDIDFILSVYPNPSDFNEETTIFYRFYPDDGEDGFIGISEFSTTSNYSSFDETWIISANTTGNKTFYPQTDVFVSLWKRSGSSFYRVKIVLLRQVSIFDNSISVVYSLFELSTENPSFIQTISGFNAVNRFSVVVRLNGKMVQDVTGQSFYSYSTRISKAGNYKAELCMETMNGSVVLCYVNFSVTGVSNIPPGGGTDETFPSEMKLLFGICCILVAVSCPLMISVKYHVAVPTFVYVVFMAFGIGIGTVLGFLELWLVFLFVVALVAGAVFTIFGHGGQGGGGGDSGTVRKGGILSRRGSKDYAGASRKADYGVSPKGSPGYLKGPGRRGY